VGQKTRAALEDQVAPLRTAEPGPHHTVAEVVLELVAAVAVHRTVVKVVLGPVAAVAVHRTVVEGVLGLVAAVVVHRTAVAALGLVAEVVHRTAVAALGLVAEEVAFRSSAGAALGMVAEEALPFRNSGEVHPVGLSFPDSVVRVVTSWDLVHPVFLRQGRMVPVDQVVLLPSWC
jgi:hypothetical protein